jgi:hypothetical protein
MGAREDGTPTGGGAFGSDGVGEVKIIACYIDPKAGYFAYRYG